MDGESSQLHILFFPFLAHGHMIPMVDMARLFAARGVKATIVTTPLNLPFVSRAIERAKTSAGVKVDILTIKFPVEEAGLPAGCENIDSITSEEMKHNFRKAIRMLREPFEQVLNDSHADCLVADLFFPWASDAAAKFGIPRLVFHGTSFFSMSVWKIMRQYKPEKKALSDSEPFVIPNFPGEIKLTKMQLPEFTQQEVETEISKFFREAEESESRSYG